VVALGFALPGVVLPVPWLVLALGGCLLLLTLICLGELYRLRPDPSGLTTFYLSIAAGGALGGLAVGAGAPVLLNAATEFPWSIFAVWTTLAILLSGDRASFWHHGSQAFYAGFLFFTSAGLLRLCNLAAARALPPWLHGWAAPVAGGILFTVVAYAVSRQLPGWATWRLWPRLFIALILFCAFALTLDDTRGAGMGVLASGRNFFGPVRVQRMILRDEPDCLQLVHGQVNHGIQYQAPALRTQPAGYCAPNSGVGQAMQNHPRRRAGQPLRIGVAGLGAGAMAAWLQPGDFMRFYEINPLVIQYAKAPFTYLRESAGQTDVVVGDARLALERELLATGSQQYDLLIMDAFSSDSVPVHLLTTEAIALYRRHLRDADSVLALNISNRFLDFLPLARAIAHHHAMAGTYVQSDGLPPVRTPNQWVLLSARLQPWFAPGAFAAPGSLWTDTQSDLFSLIRWQTK
jgi:hypothetical protein